MVPAAPLSGLGGFIDAVQRNCHVADARHAREMTLCTYLLEMREFYRWEAGLALGAALPRQEVAAWLAAREELWDAVAEDDFAALELAGSRFDPFDVAAVNALTLPYGLVYGAGFGRFGRPHFFVGRLAAAEEIDGLRVVVADCEYARDIGAFPAALQGDAVVVRREALRQWLWEKAEAWGVKRADGPLRRALEGYGYFADAAAALERMTAAETATLVLHERGEHAAGRALGPAWEEMLASLGDRRAELLARAVRDNWADCAATLPALVERAAWPALHFWFANFDGMRRLLFPALAAAGAAWADTGDAAGVKAVAAAGEAHWRGVAQSLLDIHAQRGGETGAELTAMTHAPAAIAL